MEKADAVIIRNDYWRPGSLTDDKLEVYKKLRKKKLIKNCMAVYGATCNDAAVTYRATAPMEWLLDEIRGGDDDGLAGGQPEPDRKA